MYVQYMLVLNNLYVQGGLEFSQCYLAIHLFLGEK